MPPTSPIPALEPRRWAEHGDPAALKSFQHTVSAPAGRLNQQNLPEGDIRNIGSPNNLPSSKKPAAHLGRLPSLSALCAAGNFGLAALLLDSSAHRTETKVTPTGADA